MIAGGYSLTAPVPFVESRFVEWPFCQTVIKNGRFVKLDVSSNSNKKWMFRRKSVPFPGTNHAEREKNINKIKLKKM